MSTVIVFFAARFQSIDLIVNEIFIEANCKQKGTKSQKNTFRLLGSDRQHHRLFSNKIKCSFNLSWWSSGIFADHPVSLRHSKTPHWASDLVAHLCLRSPCHISRLFARNICHPNSDRAFITPNNTQVKYGIAWIWHCGDFKVSIRFVIKNQVL
jgi:hypothetical protein